MSTWRSDDLASVLIQPDLNFAGYTTGVIKAWNADTFENTITFKGADHQDLPVMSGVEALTYAPGDVLMLMRWSPSGGGTSTYWIAGRALTPGAGRAEDTIAFLRTSLGRAIAAEVFNDRIRSDSVSAIETTTSTSYTDLTTVGPSVSGLEVVNGRLLVLMGANIHAGTSGSGTGAPAMAPDVVGPTNHGPGDVFPISVSIAVTSGTTDFTIGQRGFTAYDLAVDPGEYTVTAKYRATNGTSVQFNARSMIVIAT